MPTDEIESDLCYLNFRFVLHWTFAVVMHTFNAKISGHSLFCFQFQSKSIKSISVKAQTTNVKVFSDFNPLLTQGIVTFHSFSLLSIHMFHCLSRSIACHYEFSTILKSLSISFLSGVMNTKIYTMAKSENRVVVVRIANKKK